jgi:hypothetical protein
MNFYTVILMVLASLLSFLLITRKNVDGTIVRAAGMLYQEKGEDSLSNLYTIKVINKTLKDIPVELRVENAPGRIIEAEGQYIEVKKEAQATASFFIVLPKAFMRQRKLPVRIGLYQGEVKITTLETTFMGAFTKF